jgi:hypothetical protein
MNIGTLYKFTFTDAEKARAHLRTWVGRCDINIAATMSAGFIKLYSYDPEKTAAKT